MSHRYDHATPRHGDGAHAEGDGPVSETPPTMGRRRAVSAQVLTGVAAVLLSLIVVLLDQTGTHLDLPAWSLVVGAIFVVVGVVGLLFARTATP